MEEKISTQLKQFIHNHKYLLEDHNFKKLFDLADYHLSYQNIKTLVRMLKSISPGIFNNPKNLFDAKDFPDIIETDLEEIDGLGEMLKQQADVYLDLNYLNGLSFKDLFDNAINLNIEAEFLKHPNLTYDEFMEEEITDANLEYSYDLIDIYLIASNYISGCIAKFRINNFYFTPRVKLRFLPEVALAFDRWDLIGNLGKIDSFIKNNI